MFRKVLNSWRSNFQLLKSIANWALIESGVNQVSWVHSGKRNILDYERYSARNERIALKKYCALRY